MARIEPLQAPYSSEVAHRLEAMMPPGVPPILLFRTFARNLPMAAAMGGWGGYELGRRLSVSLRAREIVIDRTCARCGCEYEWGVHVAFFAEPAGLSGDQVASLTHGGADDGCWSEESERSLIRAVDALHERSSIDDSLWALLARHFEVDQLLDIPLLCGWYHAISFAANSAQVTLEPGAPRFADFTYKR